MVLISDVTDGNTQEAEEAKPHLAYFEAFDRHVESSRAVAQTWTMIQSIEDSINKSLAKSEELNTKCENEKRLGKGEHHADVINCQSKIEEEIEQRGGLQVRLEELEEQLKHQLIDLRSQSENIASTWGWTKSGPIISALRTEAAGFRASLNLQQMERNAPDEYFQAFDFLVQLSCVVAQKHNEIQVLKDVIQKCETKLVPLYAEFMNARGERQGALVTLISNELLEKGYANAHLEQFIEPALKVRLENLHKQIDYISSTFGWTDSAPVIRDLREETNGLRKEAERMNQITL